MVQAKLYSDTECRSVAKLFFNCLRNYFSRFRSFFFPLGVFSLIRMLCMKQTNKKAPVFYLNGIYSVFVYAQTKMHKHNLNEFELKISSQFGLGFSPCLQHTRRE